MVAVKMKAYTRGGSFVIREAHHTAEVLTLYVARSGALDGDHPAPPRVGGLCGAKIHQDASVQGHGQGAGE